MQLSMRLQAGGSQTVELADAIFTRDFNEPLVHQVVTACLANTRQGTRAQKSRADVRGGGRKPWRQKGTGRARAGSIRSPIWRGGGITFAARTQDYAQKINKKMYRAALCSVLSNLIKSERLVVIDSFTVAQPKTRLLIAQLQALNATQVMIVSHEIDEALYLAARNVMGTLLCIPETLNLVDLIRYKKIIITLPALKKLESQLV